LVTYVGTGVATDTGISIPAHEHLGVVVPPLNLHEAQIFEPSPSSRGTPSKDAPDTPSTVPASGETTLGITER
jgi:hypothetical protein